MPIARFRVRESFGALRFDTSSSRPVYMRLETDAVIAVEIPFDRTGLIEVRFGDATLTVFCEDLTAKADLLAEATGPLSE